MDRYYKTSVTSETGKKILEIFARKEKFADKVGWFCEKYGIKSFSYSKYYLCDMSSVVFNGNTMPSGSIWKRDGSEFTLRAKPRDKNFAETFKLVKKDWDAVRALKIERFEIDKAFGSSNSFLQCGIDVSNKDWVLFYTPHPESYNIPDDCQEISNLEYIDIVKQH